MATHVHVALPKQQIYVTGGLENGVAVIDKENMRNGLLSSLDDGIALLQTVQAGVTAMSDFDVGCSRKLQLELAKRNSAVTELYLRMKDSMAFVQTTEPRLPDWDHWSNVLWSIYDAVALAANREPAKEIDWDESPVFFQRLELAVHEGRLKPQFSAADFLQWFDRLGDENTVLPAGLRQAVAKSRYTSSDTGTGLLDSQRDGDHADIQSSPVDGSPADELEPRERNSLYLLLVHFMKTTTPAKITSRTGRSSIVRNSDAKRIEIDMQEVVKVDTVKAHLDNALRFEWEFKKAAVGRQPKRK